VNTSPVEEDYLLPPEWPSYVPRDLGLSQKSSTTTRKSVSMSSSSLSPLSYRFAEEAMGGDMRRVERECRLLSEAASYLRKGSREWTVVKSKLDVANDELACMLEDYGMIRNFAGDAVIEDDGGATAATTGPDDGGGGRAPPRRRRARPPRWVAPGGE